MSSGEGSCCTCVSVMNSEPRAVTSMFMAEKSDTPGASPMISRIERRRRWKPPTKPQIIASASPRFTAIAPMMVALVRTSRRAADGLMPRRPAASR